MEMNSKIGHSFEELSQEEMDFVTGGGAARPHTTPLTVTATVTPSSLGCSAIVVSVIAVSRETNCM